MSSLYLIRHGQAGTRFNYDALSDTGRTQSRLLGEYLVAQGLRFSAIYSGALDRQRLTAQEVFRTYEEAGFPLPVLVVDPEWNEFDLTAVYGSIAPRLTADDPEFRREFEAMRRAMAEDAESVNRRWTPCDAAIAKAWMDARYAIEGESWREFVDRIAGRLEPLRAHGSGETIAVFTSATPIAIMAARSLGVADGQIMKLAGALYNSAITTLRVQSHDLMLFTFNSVPHLNDPKLRTFR